MARREDAEEMALAEFSALHDRYGYRAPLITKDGWITRAAFVKGDIGIELEFDWRDTCLSVLVVRLDNGHLPKGYYVDAGRPCRKHLVSVARERRWPNAPPTAPHVRAHRGSGPEELAEAAARIRDLLVGWLDHLEGEWQEIWR